MYREEGDGNHHGKKENHESKKKGGTGRGKIGEKKTMEVVKAFWKDPTEDHQEKKRERERKEGGKRFSRCQCLSGVKRKIGRIREMLGKKSGMEVE